MESEIKKVDPEKKEAAKNSNVSTSFSGGAVIKIWTDSDGKERTSYRKIK